MTQPELEALDKEDDVYTRYWIPLHWCYGILNKARADKRIASDHVLVFLVEVIIKY